jgi:hypothetical protein
LRVGQANAAFDADEVFFNGLGKIVSMAAQLWSRIGTVVTDRPWSLLQLIDARSTDAQKEQIASDFYTCHPCELDVVFSMPLRQSIKEHAELEAVAHQLLEAVAKMAQGTNMGLERLLNLFANCELLVRNAGERVVGWGGWGALG